MSSSSRARTALRVRSGGEPREASHENVQPAAVPAVRDGIALPSLPAEARTRQRRRRDDGLEDRLRREGWALYALAKDSSPGSEPMELMRVEAGGGGANIVAHAGRSYYEEKDRIFAVMPGERPAPIASVPQQIAHRLHADESGVYWLTEREKSWQLRRLPLAAD